MRPERLRLPDFARRLVSLPDDPESWHQLKAGSKGTLLLGVGPKPGNFPVRGPLFWVEAPHTLKLLRSHIDSFALPCAWQKLDPAKISEHINDHDIWFYAPGLKLAPDFWGPVLAKIALANTPAPRTKSGFAWLPGVSTQLLHSDLLSELTRAGFQVCQETPARHDLNSLLQIWNDKSPDFILSVNFRGLDPEGRIFELCRQLDIPLAVWLVDNPWNILSGITLPWWKQANLFTTDASFVQPLQDAGAKNVFFLPLAASATMLDFAAPLSQRTPPAFVGSSAFGERQKFFSGLKIDPVLYQEALEGLNGSELPDFHWWQKQIGARLWPGREGRTVSLGSDECSALRRAQWLQEAAGSGLRIIGDNGWKKYLRGADLRPPVDYYTQLPRIYAESECILNITSLLLPQSLNQRHFDVWAAGGFLLTDATAGLGIFPSELVEPISLASPAEFSKKLAWLRENPGPRQNLAASWRSLIRKSHIYANRLEEICAKLNVPWPKRDR